MVYFGGNEVKGVYFGASAPKAAWFNGEQVWGGEEPVPVTVKSLKFTALQSNSTVVLSATGAPGGQYVYSTNGYDFQSYTLGDSIALANEGDSVWFKAAQSNRGNTYQKYVGFNGSGLVAADGWPEAMTEPDEANWNIASYDNSYYALFYKCQNLKSLVVRGEFQNASPVHPFGAFARECPVLSSVVFPDILSASGQTTFAYSGDGMFTNAFCKDPQLLKVEFPKLEFAKSIAFWAACEYNPALLSVEFPSMTSAWNDAFFGIFNGMTGVPKVVVLSAFESVPGLLQNSGEGWRTLDSQTSVVIPDALYDTWTTTSQWSNMNVTYVKASEFVPTSDHRFRVRNIGSSDSTVQLTASMGSPDSAYLDYSTDGETWNQWMRGESSSPSALTVPAGGTLWIKASQDIPSFSDVSNRYAFAFSGGSLALEGSIMYLVSPTGANRALGVAEFITLFSSNSALVDVSELELPATEFSGNGAYWSMFAACSNLSAAVRALPAYTEIENNTFQGMFIQTGISEFPTISATSFTAGDGSQFRDMFWSTQVTNWTVDMTRCQSVPAIPGSDKGNFFSRSGKSNYTVLIPAALSAAWRAAEGWSSITGHLSAV